MGSTESKSKQFPEDVQPENIPATPILTPQPRNKINELDPRSPNTYFSRTPLQLLSAAAEQLEALRDGEMYEVDNETPAKNKTTLLGIDPRSPTTEFKRTPIVIKVEESGLFKKIHNKNLDKVRRSTIITTKSSADTPSGIVPPKLLESSPIKYRPETNKRKSFVGLLETNIDFTETDLDTVLQEKCKVKENLVNKCYTPSAVVCVGIVDNENIDPRSPSCDFLRTPIQINKVCSVENDDSKVNFEVQQEQVVEFQYNLMDKIEIEKVIQEICEIVEVENQTSSNNLTELSKIPTISEDTPSAENTIESIIEEIDSDINEVVCTTNIAIPIESKSAPVSPPPSIGKKQKSIISLSPIQTQIKSAPVTPPVVNITADVNELDKKLSNLIYQDDDIVVCPRIVKLKERNNRSPLRNCNGIEPDRRKLIQKLKVSDKPRKSDYAVSKIPVFKEKGKNQVQCENTPPQNAEKRKVNIRKSQWDNADKTLII